MSKQYSCAICNEVFKRKIDFTRHQKMKTPCIPLPELKNLDQINLGKQSFQGCTKGSDQINEVKINYKTTLINVFKNCLNIMRDNEGLTGEKALRNLSYLLILKLLEPRFGDEIDIDNYEYDFESHMEEDVIEANKKRLLSLVRFSNISKEKAEDIPNQMNFLWKIILSVHPSTKNIFLTGKGFDIQHQSTYKNLIDKINTIDLNGTEYDILGNAYEEVIQDIMTGKILGQFFTQPLIKKMMVKLIDPQIYADGKIDTCGDISTSGFKYVNFIRSYV